MIIKIQQSPNKKMLIYNKGDRYYFEGDLTDEVKQLLGTRTKAFFEAKLINTKLHILREVKTQDF